MDDKLTIKTEDQEHTHSNQSKIYQWRYEDFQSV